jgi:hypothetical protein
MKRFLPHALLSLVLLFSFAACDSAEDDGPGNVDNGEFSADFGGDLDGSFGGNAFFSVVENPDIPGERGFLLFLTDAELTGADAQYGEYIFFARLGDRPGEGSYALADITDDTDVDTEGMTYGIYYNLTGQTAAAFLGSESGSLNITSSSEDQVSGSFNFEAAGFDSSTGQPITGTLSGSFEARNANSNLVPFFTP